MGWTCQFCERTFSTNRGLGVHKRRAHPVETNTDAAPMMVKRRWHGEEIDLLARTEARLLAERGQCSGGDLFGALPGFGRTLEAIKGQRRREPYRALVQAHLARFGSQPGPSSGGARPSLTSGGLLELRKRARNDAPKTPLPMIHPQSVRCRPMPLGFSPNSLRVRGEDERAGL